MNNTHIDFIVKRLAFSKRNKGIVHIISLIALVGIAVVSMALVVVICVFNGFTGVAQTMLEKTSPPLIIESVKGRTFSMDKAKKIKNLDNIKTIIPVVSQAAMVNCLEQRSIVKVLGIDSTYLSYNPLNKSIVCGKENWNMDDSLFCVMGVSQAMDLGLNKGSEKMMIPVRITVPNPHSENAIVMEDRLSTIMVYYSACYQTHSDLDEGYVFIPIDKARNILSLNGDEVTSLYIIPTDKNNIAALQKNIQAFMGEEFSVKNILEQEPIYFRIVKSEKLAVYIILTLIIFIAMVNIISGVIILYIQKERMNKILMVMGMRIRDLKRVYFRYGMLINAIGCVVGVVVGLMVSFVQQWFGVIKLEKDSFVVDSFPIRVLPMDIIIIVLIVLIVGAISVKVVTTTIKNQQR